MISKQLLNFTDFTYFNLKKTSNRKIRLQRQYN